MKNDQEAVIEHCNKLLKEAPSNRLELLKMKAESLICINDLNGAKEIVVQILKEREIPWALLLLGQVYFYQSNLDNAKDIFNDLVRSYPNYLLGHDWLAKVYQKNQNYSKAQEVLELASEKSPKAIRRQQILAEVSFNNFDYDTSEKSYRRITIMGKNSYFTGPDDYLGLASTYLAKGMINDALDTIADMNTMYSEKDPKLSMKSLINEVFLYSRMQKNNETNKRLDMVVSEFINNQGLVNSIDAAKLASICYSLERHEDGHRFTEYAIKNNHDNNTLINQIVDDLTSSGISKDEIDNLLKSRDKVIEINNRGVKLASSGKIADSISLFIEAANEIPENQVINLNTAQSLIMHMKESGISEDLLAKTKFYLDKASLKDNPGEKYRVLTSTYRHLAEEFDSVNQ